MTDILGKIKRKGKVFYRVEWEGGDITKQPRNQMLQDASDMVQEFEDKQKRNKRT